MKTKNSAWNHWQNDNLSEFPVMNGLFSEFTHITLHVCNKCDNSGRKFGANDKNERNAQRAEINRHTINQNKKRQSNEDKYVSWRVSQPASQWRQRKKERKKTKRVFRMFCILSEVAVLPVSLSSIARQTQRNSTIRSQNSTVRHRAHEQSASSHSFFFLRIVRTGNNQQSQTQKKRVENFVWLLHLLGISAIAYTSNVTLSLSACVCLCVC